MNGACGHLMVRFDWVWSFDSVRSLTGRIFLTEQGKEAMKISKVDHLNDNKN